jgi:acetylornithine deacetylase
MDVRALTLALCSIDSTSGSEGAVVEWLDNYLRQQGWATERIPVTPGRDALYAGTGVAPVVTLSTHVDTVPPFIPPHEQDGWLHGRGVCDAKGIAAAMILAADRLRDRGVAVALLFVVGEEVSHDGAHAANAWVLQRGITCRALINGEPTDNLLGLGTKGAVRLVIRTTGTEAHSAYPELGRSATRDLARLLAELDDLQLPVHPVLGPTTVNIGFIAGGVADNVVAPTAHARLMIRLVTPLEEVQAIVERWVAGRATVEWEVTVPPVLLPVVPGFETAVVAFATDIPELTNWGTPYLLGPGSIHVAHRPDERVSVAELEQAVDAYERLALAVVQG